MTSQPNAAQSAMKLSTAQTTRAVISPSGRIVLTQSIEDILPKNATQNLNDGTYKMSNIGSEIKKRTGSLRNPTLFITPNTSVKIEYSGVDGSSSTRIINNTYDTDSIMTNTDNVSQITVSRLNKIRGIEKFTSEYNNNSDNYESMFFYTFLIFLMLFIYYCLVVRVH